jgi:hypothetical protein
MRAMPAAREIMRTVGLLNIDSSVRKVLLWVKGRIVAQK